MNETTTTTPASAPTGISARVILDSMVHTPHRLTTMEVTFPRFILAEFNTHRVFSRNSASSRAIPIEKQFERVMENPYIPIEPAKNQKGMQAGEKFDEEEQIQIRRYWLRARDHAVVNAEALLNLGLHKQWVNRLLEPFMWHTVIVSATEWDGFWEQRCSPLAQPEMRMTAEAMRAAYEGSTPSDPRDRSSLRDSWHTPLILPEEYEQLTLADRIRISAARCARVSYLTHDGRRDWKVDLELYAKLREAKPPHWSPMEHVACPVVVGCGGREQRNFVGWMQYRTAIELNLI